MLRPRTRGGRLYQSGEGDHHRRALVEQKRSSLTEEAYHLEQKREGVNAYQS